VSPPQFPEEITMADDAVTTLIHTLPSSRNPDEEIRMTLRCYKEREYMDIRVWYRPKESKEFYPTKRGICLGLDHLNEIERGFHLASDMTSTATSPADPKSKQENHR